MGNFLQNYKLLITEPIFKSFQENWLSYILIVAHMAKAITSHTQKHTAFFSKSRKNANKQIDLCVLGQAGNVRKALACCWQEQIRGDAQQTCGHFGEKLSKSTK